MGKHAPQPKSGPQSAQPEDSQALLKTPLGESCEVSNASKVRKLQADRSLPSVQLAGPARGICMFCKPHVPLNLLALHRHSPEGMTHRPRRLSNSS